MPLERSLVQINISKNSKIDMDKIPESFCSILSSML